MKKRVKQLKGVIVGSVVIDDDPDPENQPAPYGLGSYRVTIKGGSGTFVIVGDHADGPDVYRVAKDGTFKPASTEEL